MTNYDFLINSDKELIAEILASLIASAFEQANIPIFNNSRIFDMEVDELLKWLNTELVSGDYLN